MKTIVYLCLLIGCFAATLTRAKSQPDWSWLLERTALPPRDLINDKQFIELHRNLNDWRQDDKDRAILLAGQDLFAQSLNDLGAR